MELIIGSHVSFKSDTQLYGSIMEMLKYKANTCMIYTGAPQNTNRKNIDDNLTLEAYKLMKDNNVKLEHLIAHAPYIINLANTAKMDSYNFAIDFLTKEIERCEELGITKLVLHPGSYVNLNAEIGIHNIINALNKVIRENQKVIILLETMAGKGSEIGCSFKELQTIYNGIIHKDKIGICLDTCHLHDSGYNLDKFDDILNEFTKYLPLDLIKCVHVNDSKNINGSRKDRHENIGYGEIGFNNLINVIYHPLLAGIPMILETPYIDNSKGDSRVYAPYKHEIEMIKNRVFNENLLKDIRDEIER